MFVKICPLPATERDDHPSASRIRRRAILSDVQFVRFVVPIDHPRAMYGSVGIMGALVRLVRSGTLSDEDQVRAQGFVDWFNAAYHAPEGDEFRGNSKAATRAVFWFKESAVQTIAKTWELVGFMKDQGAPVTVLRTRVPGYIVYEDSEQIAAEPFATTPR